MLKPKGVATPPAVTASFGEEDKQNVSSSGLGESEPFPSQTGSLVQDDEHHARSYQYLFQEQLRHFLPTFYSAQAGEAGFSQAVSWIGKWPISLWMGEWLLPIESAGKRCLHPSKQEAHSLNRIRILFFYFSSLKREPLSFYLVLGNSSNSLWQERREYVLLNWLNHENSVRGKRASWQGFSLLYSDIPVAERTSLSGSKSPEKWKTLHWKSTCLMCGLAKRGDRQRVSDGQQCRFLSEREAFKGGV